MITINIVDTKLSLKNFIFYNEDGWDKWERFIRVTGGYTMYISILIQVYLGGNIGRREVQT